MLGAFDNKVRIAAISGAVYAIVGIFLRRRTIIFDNTEYSASTPEISFMHFAVLVRGRLRLTELCRKCVFDSMASGCYFVDAEIKKAGYADLL